MYVSWIFFLPFSDFSSPAYLRYYGIKKKEEENPEFDFSSPEGRLGRKRKTAAELAAEASAAEEAENSLTNMLPENMRDIAHKVTEVPGKLISEATDKCTAM
ncbi:hypothetical protein CRM22_001068 [Opisthorchis felineus]|uniref:Uncharacterized protein n=1 Tax=Opisthorchis felineus TaxID=147828 RepID=A0A4S2MGH9_OPIFE|nr:hypothetical protein CRM22_001068 [Opisthorchis felineus]